MKQKVLIYVIRATPGQQQVLVFDHRDYPEAGTQVPAGTVEPGEAFEAAAYREVLEESGLGAHQVRLVRKLTEVHETQPEQVRHVFLFEPRGPLPDKWRHTVAGSGEDEGMVFEFTWLPVTPALKLAGEQERFLHLAGVENEAER